MSKVKKTVLQVAKQIAKNQGSTINEAIDEMIIILETDLHRDRMLIVDTDDGSYEVASENLDVIEEKWMGFAHSILSQQMSTEEFFDDVDCIDITVQDRVSDFIAEFGDWASMGWKEENNSTVVLARFLYKEFK